MDRATKFDILIDELGLEKNSQNSAELVFKSGIEASIQLHSDGEIAVIAIDFYDSSALDQYGKLPTVFKSLLILNDITLQQSSCYIGLGHGGVLTLIGTIKLTDMDSEALTTRLHHLEDQALWTKKFVEASLDETEVGN